jgi:hypothetical protein
MTRTLLALFAIAFAASTQAQTYFYIGEIAVNPQPASTSDNISIDLIGGLSSTGASVTSASAQVSGNTVTISIAANDIGGLTVIVPHTETLQLGQLPAGTYTIEISGTNVGDFAPQPQHQFIVSGSGSPCGDLIIESILWHAFTDTAIVVHVTNNSSFELFDYPNFILFDANGDTLAKEVVNFFGIASESWHLLAIHPDAQLPSGPFNGTLELWTLFTTVLSCDWSLLIDLCPPAPCAEVLATVQNFGGALAIGDYNYSIFDEDMVLAASGTLTMTESLQVDSDPLCLPPGNYSMSCYAAQPPTGGWPVFVMVSPGWISGPQQSVSFDLPVLTPFSFFAPCIDGTNGINPIAPPALLLHLVGDALRVRRTDGAPLGTVELFDAQGRLLQGGRTTAGSVDLSMSKVNNGIVVVKADGLALRWLVVK